MSRRAAGGESLRHLPREIEGFVSLDAPFRTLQQLGRRLVPSGPVKDMASGTALGHPLHPVLTDIPIGCWTSAFVLDLVGGRSSRTAARRLVALGVIAAVHTALTGLSDGADTEGATGRVVTAHAIANSVAMVLYVGSWRARRREHHARGVALGLLGAAAATVGGMLGGDLAYRKGIGVDQTAFTPGADTKGTWTTAPSGSIEAGGTTLVEVDGEPVLVARDSSGRLRGLHDRCTHRGGPLHEGEMVGGCVTCPWHGSRFRLVDGSVDRGPATAPAPVYDVREAPNGIELRAATRV